jgi:hypothetical protein
MPGTDRSHPPYAHQSGAGRSPSVLDRTCAALARSAESIDQHARHVAEVAKGSLAVAAKCKAIREALVAKHGDPSPFRGARVDRAKRV